MTKTKRQIRKSHTYRVCEKLLVRNRKLKNTRSRTKGSAQLPMSGQIELLPYAGAPYKITYILDGLNPIMNNNQIDTAYVTLNYVVKCSTHSTLAP